MTESLSYSRTNYKKFLAHLGTLLIMIAWGCSFLSTKILMVDGGLTPAEIYIYRFTGAYLLLLVFTFNKIFSNNWKDEFQFFICGLCAGSLYYVTENYALERTTTGNVSLLASTSPIMTTILISLVYHTKIKAGVIIGSLIAFAGVICIIFSRGEGLEIHPLGDILALSASFSWAIYTLVIKNLNPFYNSLFITRKLFFYGVITALPLMFFQDEPLHLSVIFNFDDPQFFLNFAFLVFVCSALGYLIWSETMKVLGPVTANNYLYLQPLVTMVAAYFVLDEQIYFLGYLGCMLIIGGLIFSDKVNMKFPRSRRVN